MIILDDFVVRIDDVIAEARDEKGGTLCENFVPGGNEICGTEVLEVAGQRDSNRSPPMADDFVVSADNRNIGAHRATKAALGSVFVME